MPRQIETTPNLTGPVSTAWLRDRSVFDALYTVSSGPNVFCTLSTISNRIMETSLVRNPAEYPNISRCLSNYRRIQHRLGVHSPFWITRALDYHGHSVYRLNIRDYGRIRFSGDSVRHIHLPRIPVNQGRQGYCNSNGSRGSAELSASEAHLLNEIHPDQTFGVEIEFNSSISGSEVVQAFTTAGLFVENRSGEYGRSSADHWVLCYDQSCGLELTTPALKGQTGLKELKAYTNVLNSLAHDQKIKITPHCGGHVHFGNFGSLSVARAFREQYRRNETWIDQVVPASRRGSNNTYCRSIINDGTLRSENEKYQKVSLRKFTSNGTLEVRHAAGTLNFLKIVNWVVFIQKALVKSAVPVAVLRTAATWMEYFSSVVSGAVLTWFSVRRALHNPGNVVEAVVEATSL